MSTVFDHITNEIISAIETGADAYEMPWHRSGTHRPANAITGRPYRGINVLLLWAEASRRGYQSGLWATYRQWHEAGARVRKGERSTLVLLWKPIPASNDDGDRADDLPPRLVVRAFRVFNADQVDGFEAPAIAILPETERLRLAETFFEHQAAAVWVGSDQAFYDPRSDTISMPSFGTFKTAAGYYAVLAHEFVHWTGAKPRLDRDLSGRFGTDAYAMEELIAELGAAFVASHLGLPSEPRRDHAPYIQSWLKVLGNDPRAILAAASQAQAAADYLIAATERTAANNHMPIPEPLAETAA